MVLQPPSFLVRSIASACFMASTLAITTMLAVGGGAAVAQTGEAISVREVMLAAPDIVAIDVREPTYRTGRIVQLDGPASKKNGEWIKTDDGWGMVIGPKRDFVRLADEQPTLTLDRKGLDRAADYGPIGGRKVVAVYRKSMPYDSGVARLSSGATSSAATFKHVIFLKLDGAVAKGTHTIAWPRKILPDTSFTADDTSIRASGLHVNQNGYGAADRGKFAYLGQWLPGGPDNGAVDYRTYGLDRFEIVDAAGRAVFTGRMTLRKGPSDPEPGNGLPQPTIEQPTASAPAVQVSGLERANPARIVVADGHRFTTGQRVWLQGFTDGLASLNGGATVGAVTRTSFELQGVDGRSLQAAAGAMGTASQAVRINRAGTYVFELDFGAWQPGAPGTFRVRVPGLGVSDPFEVSDAVWLRAARVSFGGLYNHRSGPALDGRFGYTRPAAFMPATMPIMESRLPLTLSDNAPGGFIPFGEGAKGAWATTVPAPADAWGGYMDAGDWDRRIQHLEISYLLMDLLEYVPGSATAGLGLPRSAEALDPALYAGTDALPEVMHEVLWNLDFYRRLQTPSGGIRGGIESSGHPATLEPSFLNHLATFVYAPDYVSSFRYAAAAAKLSRLLGGLDQPRLAALYRDSALAAWTYAEAGYANPDESLAEALRTAFATGQLTPDSWPARRDALQTVATEHRVAAAANLARLTGDARYRKIVLDAWAGGFDVYNQFGDAAWELANDAGAPREVRDAARAAFTRTVQYVLDGQRGAAYPALKHFYVPLGWGLGTVPDYNATQLLLRSHLVGGNEAILRAMQAGSAHILGANQVGLSFTTGLGLRNIRHPLHEDQRAMGVPAPPGITIYGWAAQSQANYGWIFGPDWAPIPDNPALNRTIDPNRFTLPVFEFLVEHPGVVIQQEYTVNQTIGPLAAIWLYLHTQQKSARAAP